jgi:hypothetical protein
MGLILTTNRRFIAKSLLLLLILSTIVIYTGRVLNVFRFQGLDLSGRMVSTLSASTRTYLKSMDSHLSITYFVTPRSGMPSHLKHVEDSVSNLLVAIRKCAPELVEFRTIYPELGGEAGAHYASIRKASPFRTRHINLDERSESKVWSSLVISTGALPEILIQGIESSDLPYLEELIFDNLRAVAGPPRPNIVVSSPPGFDTLTNLLGELGNTRRVDLDSKPTIPPDTDLLFWIQPEQVTAEHLSELKRYLASGRPAILAGSPYAIAYTIDLKDVIGFKTVSYGRSWQSLLAPFGVTPLGDLLMDQNNSPIYWAGPEGTAVKIQAPFQLRCMPGFYDLKGFAAPARGALSFVAAGPLHIDLRRAEKSGYEPRVLATTTDGAYVQPLPTSPFILTDLIPDLSTGKQNLMVLMDPSNTWAGQLLIFASSSLFRDGIIDQPGHAHRVLLKNLTRTFGSPERLVRGRIVRTRLNSLPPLSAAQRLSWRLFIVILSPTVLMLIAGVRYRSTHPLGDLSFGPLPTQAIPAVALMVLGVFLWSTYSGPSLDLTRNQNNSILPQTQNYFPKSRNHITLQLIITPQANMPAEMKQVEGATASRIRALDLPLSVIRPQTLSPMEVEEFRTQGLIPFATQTIRNDSLVTQEIWSGLRLFKGNQIEVINRVDHRSVDHLEFLLATTFRRLDTARSPVVAVLAEGPRLSPAEAYTDYYQNRLIPPKGAHVFSESIELLKRYGYEVVTLDPRNPKLIVEPDLLIWFQPRRDASPGIGALSRHLSRGGKAVVGLQHYNIQQRQYRGTGFNTVYWPQPQFQDLNQYLEMMGIVQVKEVLMDRTRSDLILETQINRRAVREYEPQQVALPFLIRTVSENFNRTDPITHGLGDQLFIWGNRFSIDWSLLEANQGSVDTLITTSEVSWAYDWKGGWLPPEVFNPSEALLGPQPLAIRVNGHFPISEPDSAGVLVRKPATSAENAELILIGSSEMFKNSVLYHPEFGHDQLLLNAVSYAIYGPGLTALQSRTRTPRGFVFQSAGDKQLWKIIVITTGPLLLLLFGLVRLRRRRIQDFSL